MGKDASFTNTSIGGAKLSKSGGTLTVTTNATGTSANSSSFSDSIPGSTSSSSGSYTAIANASLTNQKSNAATIDGSKYILDVSAYKGNTSLEDCETFIQSLAGITNNYFKLAGQYTSSYYESGPYEFIDTGSKSAVAGITKVANGTTSTKIDLHKMRAAVTEGKDIATAFSETVKNAANPNNR